MGKLFIAVVIIAVGVCVLIGSERGSAKRKAELAHFQNVKSNPESIEAKSVRNADGSYTLPDGSRAVLDAQGNLCPCRPGGCVCDDH